MAYLSSTIKTPVVCRKKIVSNCNAKKKTIEVYNIKLELVLILIIVVEENFRINSTTNSGGRRNLSCFQKEVALYFKMDSRYLFKLEKIQFTKTLCLNTSAAPRAVVYKH